MPISAIVNRRACTLDPPDLDALLHEVLLAGLAWVATLDRRVRRQTQIIQQKVRREGVLEERDRLARQFHDTLEQELAAINIQLVPSRRNSANRRHSRFSNWNLPQYGAP